MGAPAASLNGPNLENGLPKPGIRGAKPPELRLNDRRVRLVGIPSLGVFISNVSGLFGPLGPEDLRYWLGLAWFVLLSGLIWQGNRFFLLQQRRYYDWFDHPWRKVSLLLFANIFYTAPLTVVMLTTWYRLAGFPDLDWNAIELVTLANVICVVFITHVYETVYLIQQRESDLLSVARLDRARAEAELLALKSQVDPHFLFNSLNTLAHLIPHAPEQALRFTEGLADVYRYLLGNQRRDLVPLLDELDFTRGYVELLRLRFGDALRLTVDLAPFSDELLVPPISLQVLVENAVKHNAFDARAPLEVRVQALGDGLQVENTVRPRLSARPGAGIGLKNLDERCRRIAGRGLEIAADPDSFRVLLPLLRTGT